MPSRPHGVRDVVLGGVLGRGRRVIVEKVVFHEEPLMREGPQDFRVVCASRISSHNIPQ